MTILRIGLDITKATGPPDGIGTYTRELLTALIPHLGEIHLLLYDLDGGGHDGHDLRQLLHSLEVEIVTEREAAEGGVESGVEIGSSPDSDDLDLFHSTSWVCPPGYRGPLLFTGYDLTFLSHPQTHTVANRLRCLEGVLQARFLDADFLAISDTTAAGLSHYLEVDSSRLHRIYPGVGAAFTPGDVQLARERVAALGIDMGIDMGIEGEFLLAVGTLEPRKNLARLLDAYGGLEPGLRQRFSLLLAGGEGWRQESLRASLTERPELANVCWLGPVPLADLVALYRAATLFVYPSLAEGFGLPIVEAMACGTPVITSSGGATEETAGSAAWLVPPEDPAAIREGLEGLLGDPETRREHAARGLERARSFAWNRAAAEVVALYRRLVSR